MNDRLFDGSDERIPRLIVGSILCWLITSVSVAAGSMSPPLMLCHLLAVLIHLHIVIACCAFPLRSVGGGGLLVPLYALVLGVGTSLAIPLSTATIFGVACGNSLFIVRQRHPKANRPLIDYAAVAMMQPGELLGAVFGVLLNRLFPEVLVVATLVLVLGLTSIQTLMKATKRFRAESAERAGNSTGDATVIVPDPERAEAKEATAASATALSAIEKREARQYPVEVWLALLLMMGYIILYSGVLNGWIGRGLSVCDGSAYWVVYFSPVIVYGGMVVGFGLRNVRANEAKESSGFAFVAGDLQWSLRNCARLGTASVLAGIIAGMLGLGGGMVLGPLFVALEFNPMVATSSTGFMILFTALASAVQYFAVGRLGWQFALWFALIGAIGAQTGQRVVKKIVHKTGRPSVVIFLLGSIISLSVIVMATSGVANIVNSIHRGEPLFEFATAQFRCGE